MKYLKHFETEAEYIQFKNSEDYILPNVSYIEEIDGIMFNPDVAPVSPNVVFVYDITDTSQWIELIGSYSRGYFTSMIVDGVEMDVETSYKFDTVGLHTVEFVLYNDEIIESDAFDGCSSLISVTIPDSVTTIEDGAFYNNTNLKSFYGKFASDNGRCLIIDNRLIAFAPGGLTKYTIPNGVTEIGDNAFAYCDSLTSVIIPDSVTAIGQWAFMNCSNLTSITIPDNITTINWSAFAYCSSLISVTIPDSVTTLSGQTFIGCSSLTSVTIPDSVTTFGYDDFSGCTNLTSVYCKAVTPPAIGSNVFVGNASDRKIYVPMESVDAYKTAPYWSSYADDIVGYNF